MSKSSEERLGSRPRVVRANPTGHTHDKKVRDIGGRQGEMVIDADDDGVQSNKRSSRESCGGDHRTCRRVSCCNSDRGANSVIKIGESSVESVGSSSWRSEQGGDRVSANGKEVRARDGITLLRRSCDVSHSDSRSNSYDS